MNRFERRLLAGVAATALAVAAGTTFARMDQRSTRSGACQQGDLSAMSGGRMGMRGAYHPRGAGRHGNAIYMADSDGDGLVTLEEFSTLHNEQAAARFVALDSDGDGVISSEEHATRPARGAGAGMSSGERAALHQCMENELDATLPMPSDPETRFAASDSNGDGAIDSEEFAAAAATRGAERFAGLDSDGDGVIAIEEWSETMVERHAARAACITRLQQESESVE